MARNYWILRGDEPDLNRDLFEQRYGYACEHVSGHVVDAACGYGWGSQLLANVEGVTQVTAVDIDAEYICTAIGAQEDLPGQRVAYQVVDLQDRLDLLPACDWVVTLETVEHLPDHLLFLAEVKRQARVGIVISTPIVQVSHRAGNYHDFKPAEIDSWFDSWGEKVTSVRIPAFFGGSWRQNVYYLGVYRR